MTDPAEKPSLIPFWQTVVIMTVDFLSDVMIAGGAALSAASATGPLTKTSWLLAGVGGLTAGARGIKKKMEQYQAVDAASANGKA